MNGIAGIFNILLICGWSGIFVSKDSTRDMMWPDMAWIYILTYDLWNFAYTYNCISDHSVYCGMLLLLSCTIPSFFIKRGCWLQHRAQTLALWIMFIMTVPTFAESILKAIQLLKCNNNHHGFRTSTRSYPLFYSGRTLFNLGLI